MNVADFHLVVRNDKHCPTCRRWYLIVRSNESELEDDSVEWEDEWIRRRNGDKFQTINIIPGREYDLSKWKLKSNSDINVNVTHFLLKIIIDDTEWCPDNIKFYVSFYENPQKAYDDVRDDVMDLEWMKFTDLYYQTKHNENLEKTDRDRIENLQIPNLEDGYLYENHYKKETYFILVTIEQGKEIRLNDYCPQISEENWEQ